MFFSFPHIAIDATGEVGSIGYAQLQHALSNLPSSVLSAPAASASDQIIKALHL